MLYHNPVMLARRVSTLDVLSGGRVRLGLGRGWSKDEFDVLGVQMKGRGARAGEFVQVLKAVWASDPVEFDGKYYTLPTSHISPKPVQKPHPPIYMAAFAPAALNRTARLRRMDPGRHSGGRDEADVRWCEADGRRSAARSNATGASGACQHGNQRQTATRGRRVWRR